MSVTAIHVVIVVIVASNLILLIATILAFYFTNKFLRDSYKKASETSIKKYEGTQDAMFICTDTILQQIKFVNKWQRLIAKMIQEDRKALQEHSAKTEDLRSVARRLAQRFLDEAESARGDGI